MMWTEAQEIPVRQETEVLVAGGGIAGVAAALAARREGARVLLLEKSVLLGGLATNGLINWYEPLCDGKGEQMIFGLAEELLRLSIRYGDHTLPEIWRDRTVPPDKTKVSPLKQDHIGGRYGTYFVPTLFQLLLDELLLKEGVELRLDILAARPHMDGERCAGVICECKSGRELLPAKVVIDATGDADLFYRAGAPCDQGQNYLSYVAHLWNTPNPTHTMKHRRWIACGSDLHGNGHPDNYPTISGLDYEEITRFVLDGRRMLLDRLRETECQIKDLALPSMAQLRTTRHIRGTSIMSEVDQGKERSDSIGLIGDFERPSQWYEIPWGTLYCNGFPNLLAAGRMISAQGWAWEVTRVIPACAVTGQAAGVAAAMMARRGVSAQSLDVKVLQEGLRSQGVRLHHYP